MVEMELQELIEQAIAVFGSREKALRWLTSYHRQLNTPPLDYAKSLEGIAEVTKLLNNIYIRRRLSGR